MLGPVVQAGLPALLMSSIGVTFDFDDEILTGVLDGEDEKVNVDDDK